MRVARVVVDVPAIDRAFDYDATALTAVAQAGDRVRVNLHGRSVRGWIKEFVAPARDLKPVTKWLGVGVPEALWSVCEWASQRWAGPLARFLAASSPPTIVSALPSAPARTTTGGEVTSGVVRVGPTVDPLELVLEVVTSTNVDGGSVLVLVPIEAWSERLAARLAARGLAVAHASEWAKCRAGWPVVVGARGAAFAPVPRVAGAVVIDGDDERFRSEAAPTWHAVDVVRQRCADAGAPWRVSSPLPSPVLAASGPVTVAANEPAGWPRVLVADRRRADPHEGPLLTVARAALGEALEGDEEVAAVIVLQRLGTGRLLSCAQCHELALCARCGGPERDEAGTLTCDQDGSTRPRFCAHCGATKMRAVRSGVTTLARDVAAQLSVAVTEVTARTPDDVPLARVLVGTEAVLTRVRRCGTVVFADFDQYLLAPRARARLDAVSAVARAGRLVGSRVAGRGAVVLQTRRDDVVVRALVRGDMTELAREEDETCRALGLAPYGAAAHVTGEAATGYVAALSARGLAVRGGDGDFTVRADTVEELTAALAATERPAGQLRVAVE